MRKRKIKLIEAKVVIKDNDLSRKELITRFAEEARNLAYEQVKTSSNKMNVAAILLDSNFTKLSSGFNEMTVSHPRLLKFYEFPFIHAEAACLLSIKKQLKGASIIVVRSGKNGELLNAKPCIHCQNFMYHSGVRKAYFSNEEGEIEMMKITSQNLRISYQKSLSNLQMVKLSKSA